MRFLCHYECFPVLLLSLAHIAHTETVQQGWILPDGSYPDFSQTFRVGQTLPLSWSALNATVDNLWVTTFDYGVDQFSQLLAENISISNSGSWDWTIDFATNQTAADAKYVLRFKPLNLTYDPDSPEISSPGFLVLAADAPSTSASTLSAPSPTASGTLVAASSTAFTTSSSAPNATSTGASAAPSSTGLSTGAKAGIGVSAAFGGLLILAAIFVLFRYRRRNHQGVEASRRQKLEQLIPIKGPQEVQGDGNKGYRGNMAELSAERQ